MRMIFISSKGVASVTGKSHEQVLRDIKKACAGKRGMVKGKSEVHMPWSAVHALAVYYGGETRVKLIEAFNVLEGPA